MRKAVAATHARLRGRHRRPARGRRQGPRRALGRGRLRPARPPRGQRRRLRLDLRRRRPRHHAALDQEHRRRCTTATSSCSTPASRWTRSSPPTSPAPCPPTAPSPTPSARSTTPCMPRRRPAWPRSSRATSSRDVHAAAIRVIAEHLHAWGLLPEGVDVEEHPRQGARPVPPPLDGARHQPPPRHRRPRLRPGHPRAVHGRRAASPAWSSRSSPACTSRPTTSRCRSEFRGIGVRIEDDVLVTEDGYENLSAAHAAHVGRRRGVDREGLGRLTPARSLSRLPGPMPGRHCTSGVGGRLLLRRWAAGLALTSGADLGLRRGHRVHLGEQLAAPAGRTCAPRAPRTASPRPA